MNEAIHRESPPVDIEGLADANVPGIIIELGALTPTTIVTEEGVARLFGRHVVSVKRAVQRGELPPPCRLFGVNVWTVGTLIRYIESRLEAAAKEREREQQRFREHTPLPHRRRT
jgi:hypothetical protein